MAVAAVCVATYLCFAERVMLLAKDASTQLVGFCAAFPPIDRLANYAASCSVGIGVRVGVVGRLIYALVVLLAKFAVLQVNQPATWNDTCSGPVE